VELKRRDFPFIELAPWEHWPGCAPDDIRARAQNVEPFRWRGRSLEVAGRFGSIGQHRRFLFARIIGDQNQGNWVLRDGFRLDQPATFSGGERLKLAYRLRTKRRDDFPFGRLFCFDVGSPLAWIGESGFGCWLSAQRVGIDDAIAPFRLPLKPQGLLFDLSAIEVREILHEELERFDSDVRFARDWFGMEDTDKQMHALHMKRGSIEELHSLLRAVLRVEIKNLASKCEVICWVSKVEGQSWWMWHQLGYHGYHEVPLSPRLRTWERLLLGFFEPSLDGALLARHRCVRRWRENLADRADRYTLFEVSTLLPTHHERLEAALTLRDWAQGKIAPRKLELLLGSI